MLTKRRNTHDLTTGKGNNALHFDVGRTFQVPIDVYPDIPQGICRRLWQLLCEFVSPNVHVCLAWPAAFRTLVAGRG